MFALRCMHYVFDACNTMFTVFYGQILVWFGINYIPQGTIELILRDDFEPVRYNGSDVIVLLTATGASTFTLATLCPETASQLQR